MSYATTDFMESLRRTNIAPASIACVEAAWGRGDGMGGSAELDAKWSQESNTDWRGGFLMRLTDGRFVYLTGWCDYTGWGCQDGVEVHYFDAMPTLDALPPPTEFSDGVPSADGWDMEPADLNRWLANPTDD